MVLPGLPRGGPGLVQRLPQFRLPGGEAVGEQVDGLAGEKGGHHLGGGGGNFERGGKLFERGGKLFERGRKLFERGFG